MRGRAAHVETPILSRRESLDRTRRGGALASLASLAALLVMPYIFQPVLAVAATSPLYEVTAPASPTPEVVRVVGHGTASFPDPVDPLQQDTGCHFKFTPQSGDVPATFRCHMSDQAIALGVPFSLVDGTATSTVRTDSGDALVSGTSTVTPPDDGSATPRPPHEGVGFAVLVQTGGEQPDFQITLYGVFDGKAGDTQPGDKDYQQWSQTLTAGSLAVQERTPSPTPSTTPSPTGSPTPSPTVSHTPSPTPSPTVSHTPPPTPTQSASVPAPTFSPPASPTPPFSAEGPHSTAQMMATLSQLAGGGTPSEEMVLSVVGPFPVAGLAWWQNDWHAYRCCPYPHLHQGLDLFAAWGTPVVAAADGFVSQRVVGAISGLGVEIQDADNTQYFYAHLSSFATGLAVGQQVHVGQVLGYVGNTGDAVNTASHLHFEVQPNGVPVPPMPYVDRWLVIAEQKAVDLVRQRLGFLPPPPTAALPQWLAEALALAGGDLTEEESDESVLTGTGQGDSGTTGTGSGTGLLGGSPPKVASQAMMAFAAGMFFLFLIVPGVASERRRTRREREARSRTPATGRAGDAGSNGQVGRNGQGPNGHRNGSNAARNGMRAGARAGSRGNGAARNGRGRISARAGSVRAGSRSGRSAVRSKRN